MESFRLLMEGFATALTPVNLLYALAGVTLPGGILLELVTNWI